jgi:hypothetical protein
VGVGIGGAEALKRTPALLVETGIADAVVPLNEEMPSFEIEAELKIA